MALRFDLLIDRKLASDDGVLGVATGTGALLAAAAGRLGPTGYVVR